MLEMPFLFPNQHQFAEGYKTLFKVTQVQAGIQK